MLGLSGIGVLLAYTLSIGAALLCVVYGVKNWNVPADDVVSREVAEEKTWEQHEPDNDGEEL
ncbi:MAG: hypothetical protein GXY14_07840 [Spirochaetes bacterium]|nr:hypothetical protein [Spirochaetota bacterium]